MDNTLYTGITDDLRRRMMAHAAGKGAKYTASHPISEVCMVWTTDSRANASKLEYRIKKLSKSQKEDVISGKTDVFSLISLEKNNFALFS